MLKFVLAEQEMIIVKKEEAAYANIYKVTEWSFAQNKNDTVSFKENETHADISSEKHQMFTDEKSLRNFDAVMNLLLQEEIIMNNS